MISLGRALMDHALDQAFCRLMREQAAAVIATRDVDAFRRNVEDLCEARQQAARAIDTALSG